MVKVGIFGCYRGAVFAQLAPLCGAKITAVFDKNETMVDRVKEHAQDYKICKSFEELLESDIEAVVLTNYFTEHAPYAIKALKAGKHVFSETMSNITLAEGVELCEAVEESGKIYAFAENYPFMKSCLELKRVYEKGEIGRVLYGEGEYVHPIECDEMNQLAPGTRHWRNWLPSTYYCTHALAPLMYMTGTTPKTVIARSIFAPDKSKHTAMHNADATAIMLIQMDNGSLFRTTGWARHYSHCVWYRLGCTNGSTETVRPDPDKKYMVNNQIFDSEWHDEGNAEGAGHGGGDFGIFSDFINAIEKNEKPAFDVYSAVTMAAVGILAWRSVLDHGKEMIIPDYKDKTTREKLKFDTLSPFPDENGNADIPCCSNPDYKPTEEDLAYAEEIWKKNGLYREDLI
ncbi:MAG: hypothetical protein DBX47_03905 [Clostridiales bacterium]|nr:MAG: hypothetical protein DBX47_03905 [Clostridiales bacterium]